MERLAMWQRLIEEKRTVNIKMQSYDKSILSYIKHNDWSLQYIVYQTTVLRQALVFFTNIPIKKILCNDLHYFRIWIKHFLRFLAVLYYLCTCLQVLLS